MAQLVKQLLLTQEIRSLIPVIGKLYLLSKVLRAEVIRQKYSKWGRDCSLEKACGGIEAKHQLILQNWSHVISYVNKALATPDFAEGTMKGVDNANLLTGLNCAYGLAELATRKYKSAAKRFLMAHLDHCNIPDIMSTQVS